MKKLLTAFVWCLGLGWALSVAAQSYPAKPIHFIVPFPPGGGTDLLARTVASKLTEALGQQVVVENRSGARGNIGTTAGAKAPPDGYTITLAFVSVFSINPWLFRDTGFDPIKDFAAVTLGITQPWLLTIHPSVPVKSMKELAALAKRQPGKLTFGSSASGTQLVGELFKQITGTDMLHVPYKGLAPALIDLIAGNIDMMYSGPSGILVHVKAKKLRAIAVTGPKRLPALPDMPTAGESGFPEFDEVIGWYGIVAPAATPKDIVAKLNAEIVRVLRLPDVKERLSGAGMDPAPTSSGEFAAIIRKDYERWGKIIKLSGVKVDD